MPDPREKTTSRAVAGFADFEDIEQAEFKDEVLLLRSGGTGF